MKSVIRVRAVSVSRSAGPVSASRHHLVSRLGVFAVVGMCLRIGERFGGFAEVKETVLCSLLRLGLRGGVWCGLFRFRGGSGSGRRRRSGIVSSVGSVGSVGSWSGACSSGGLGVGMMGVCVGMMGVCVGSSGWWA